MSDMTCAELAELVSEFLAGRLSPRERERVRLHLLECDGCRAHVEQMRTALRVAGTLPPEGLSEAAGERLVAAFRSWAASR
jgi:anti-sigma factor RsiW